MGGNRDLLILRVKAVGARPHSYGQEHVTAAAVRAILTCLSTEYS